MKLTTEWVKLMSKFIDKSYDSITNQPFIKESELYKTLLADLDGENVEYNDLADMLQDDKAKEALSKYRRTTAIAGFKRGLLCAVLMRGNIFVNKETGLTFELPHFDNDNRLPYGNEE